MGFKVIHQVFCIPEISTNGRKGGDYSPPKSTSEFIKDCYENVWLSKICT